MDQGDDSRPQRDDSLEGVVLGERYRLGHRIGAGAAGEVYIAESLADAGSVAVKTLTPKVASQIEWVSRFRREARVLGQLDHPNSVRMIDFGHTGEGMVYLVMELLEGEDLFGYLRRRGRLSLQGSIEIAVQILGALHDAHGKGITHRDLKPSNIFLCQPNAPMPHVKVIDYGLAKDDVALNAEALTREGAIIGTPAYMAPEQCLGKKVDGRADIYAVGVLFYEMLAGRPAFEGRDPMAVLTRKLRDTVPDIAAMRPDLADPRAVQAVIAAMTARDPSRRVARPLEAIERLDGLLRGGGAVAVQHEATAMGIEAMPDDDEPAFVPDSLLELGAQTAGARPLPVPMPAARPRRAEAAIAEERTITDLPSIVGDDAERLDAEAQPSAPPPASPPPTTPPPAAGPPPAAQPPQPSSRATPPTPRRAPAPPRPTPATGTTGTGTRRAPRGPVSFASVSLRVRVDVTLTAQEAAQAGQGAVSATLFVAAGRPPIPLSLQRTGGWWRGEAELARPTCKGVRLDLAMEASPGTAWRVQVRALSPQPRVVGAADGAFDGPQVSTSIALES